MTPSPFLISSGNVCWAMEGRSALTVCPVRASRPNWRCRSPETLSWTAAPDMASLSPQTPPCWSGMLLQVHTEPVCHMFVHVDECFLILLSKWLPALCNSTPPGATHIFVSMHTQTQTHIDRHTNKDRVSFGIHPCCGALSQTMKTAEPPAHPF